jgi:hypothetical protein
VLDNITRLAVHAHTSDKAGGEATCGRGVRTPWRSTSGHAVQAAPGAPRGVKAFGRRGARRKARGSGGGDAADP